MILNSAKLADLLATSDKGSDPLVVTPEPDLDALRRKVSASLDLRLGCWFAVLRQTRASLLDIRETEAGKVGEHGLTKLHYVRFGDRFVLHPRSFLLGVALEWIRLPMNLGGYVTSKSRWGRRGLIIATATGVHPGFTGCLTLELSNVGEIPIALYPGMEICQFFIHTVDESGARPERSNLAGRRTPYLGPISLEEDEFAKRLARDT
ncbi:MAG: dCTP deaminase [bacterium]